MMRSLWIVLPLLGIGLVAACGNDKKEPLHPDNPNADPLMMDAGEPALTPTPDGGTSETVPVN